MKKYLVLIIFIFSFVLSGCGMKPLNFDKESGPVLYTFTDATGMTFEFKAKPQRIVSLNNSVDEVLLDLVPYDRIAALTRLADDESICCAVEKAKNVPGRVHGSNLEQIVALRGDVVLAGDWVGADYINSLRQYGVKLVALHTPTSYREIMQYIQQVATIVGEPEAGRRMVRDLQHRAEYFRNKAVSAYGEEKLSSLVAISTMGVMGQRGTFSDICYLAGVRNALENVYTPTGMPVSDEKLLELNPDIMLLPSWDYSKSKNMEEYRQNILNNPAYKRMKAIQNGRVYQIHDQYLYSTSQYSVRAIEEIAHVAYPELYAGEKLSWK